MIRRSDDNADALSKRLAVYHSQTVPLVQYYQKRGLHVELDAAKPPDTVTEDIRRVMAQRVSKDKVMWI